MKGLDGPLGVHDELLQQLCAAAAGDVTLADRCVPLLAIDAKEDHWEHEDEDPAR